MTDTATHLPLSDDESPAFRALYDWCLSTDPVGGDWWNLVCEQLGVDPETFAALVNYTRKHLTPEDVASITAARERVDAATYMRNYMRQRRAKQREAAA